MSASTPNPTPKRGPGRPKLTEEERLRRAKEREAAKADTPKRRPGRPKTPRPERPEPRPFRAPSARLTLTPETHRAIVSAIANDGLTLRQAALSLGIPYPKTKGWIADGREYIEAGDTEHPCAILTRDVDAARAHFEAESVRQLNWELDQGIRCTERLSWLKTRLAISSPEDWGPRAMETSAGGAITAAEIAKAMESLQAKLTRILEDTPEPKSIPEEEADNPNHGEDADTAEEAE